ncbi:hypothetical protein HID58_015741 [Brassica napus]|uniref:Uncharacterized protein n=1 Tax=Brassica napus TaxID=3708 RepID=A0ABQ8DKY1_BRANA|nr:hypothetical protein HID58_015741 [Brassica napus]
MYLGPNLNQKNELISGIDFCVRSFWWWCLCHVANGDRRYEAVERRGHLVSTHSLRLPLLSLSLSPSKAITGGVTPRREPDGFTVQSKDLPAHRISTSFRPPSSILTDSRRISPSSSESNDTRKENLSKLAILDTLLTKPGTLSEAEEVVKNKLLAQLF